MIKETFKARSYSPELITGRYIRNDSDHGFLVVEAATCLVKGPFYGMLGCGPTLREYVTDGEGISEEILNIVRDTRHNHMIRID